MRRNKRGRRKESSFIRQVLRMVLCVSRNIDLSFFEINLSKVRGKINVVLVARLLSTLCKTFNVVNMFLCSI